jgi:membrane protein DedA with SNARE-associated domain
MPPFHGLYEHQLGIWAYLVIAILVMVEGPIATLVGAVASSAGYLHPVAVFFSASTGNLTADVLWYLLGYLGNIEWLTKYGRYAGLKAEQVTSLENEIRKHVLQIIFIAKITMGFMIPVLIATGLAKVPLKRWFYALISGEVIWTGGLVYAGYHFGRYIRTMERGLQFFALGGALLFVFLTFQFISKKRKQGS